MIKLIQIRHIVVGLSVLTLTACQQLPHTTTTLFQQHWIAPMAQPIEKSNNTVKIYCSGVSSCEFTRLNHLQLLNPQTGWVAEDAVQQGIIRFQGTSFSTNKRLPFYLSVPAKRHEVAINFYPISKNRAEKFVVIHQFKSGYQYTFHMYRQREKQGSLLAMSAPNPLCVELLQNQIAIKRFCRAHDALTGLGEFVEQKIE